VISPHNPPSAEQIVRAGLAAADRRRRSRDASRRIWRIAPLFAAACAAMALAGRWVGWPALLPVGALLSGMATLTLYALIAGRSRPVSDTTAAVIDADADMGGELRSASWFARRERRDDWADFHLAAAAARLQAVDWAHLYPAIRAPKAQLGTAALIVLTVAIAATMPERVAGIVQTGDRNLPRAAGAAPTAEIAVLDPELQKLLDELLAAAANGTLSTPEAMATNSEMRDLLTKLNQMNDRELLEALKRALAANPTMEAKTAADNLKALAEQFNRNPEMTGGLSPELQEALNKLSDELELAEPEAGTQAAAESGASGQRQEAMAQTGAPGGMQELSIQFAKEPDAGSGTSVVMMSSQDAQQPGGPPGGGVGGSGSQDAAASGAALEAALKQETVEASQDSAGDNVESEVRRRTEHGSATVAFTGTAAGTFDRSRAAAPPPVPEGRRTGVRTYFVRKPQ
jgi:hypothetical protein